MNARPPAHYLLAAVCLLAVTACGELPSGPNLGTTGGSAPASAAATTNSGASPTGGETGGSTTGGTSTGGTTTGGTTAGTTGGTLNGVACPTYANFAQAFFTTTCSKCHAATTKEPNYQDLPTVLASIDDKNGKKGIKNRIDSGNMPDGGPKVTGTTLSQIDNWMDPNCRK